MKIFGSRFSMGIHSMHQMKPPKVVAPVVSVEEGEEHGEQHSAPLVHLVAHSGVAKPLAEEMVCGHRHRRKLMSRAGVVSSTGRSGPCSASLPTTPAPSYRPASARSIVTGFTGFYRKKHMI